MNLPRNSPHSRVMPPPGRRAAKFPPPLTARILLTTAVVVGLAAPCHAARSGHRPKVTITVHDTGTPPIGNK